MYLRELESKDADGMLSWMHDEQVNSVFATDFDSFTQEKVAAFIAAAKLDKDNRHLACVDDKDVYLGTVSLKNIDHQARNAEYAISFCRDAHGTGAAAYATKEILRVAFQELNLERVYLNVSAENKRANAFYQKMGFTFEGEFRKHILIQGQLVDLRWYAVLREEFSV